LEEGMIIVRLALIFIGSYLVVSSLARIAWEYWSWAWFGYVEEKPLQIEGNPRVYIRLHLWCFAAGATMISAGVMI